MNAGAPGENGTKPLRAAWSNASASPGSQSSANTRAFPDFPQARREVQTFTVAAVKAKTGPLVRIFRNNPDLSTMI
jgi:hypothetical protein